MTNAARSFALLAAVALAASTGHAVRADPARANLDVRLGTAVARVLDASTDAVRANADETRWLARVRESCSGAAACLAHAYRARIALLEATARARNPWISAHAPRHVAVDAALQRRLDALVPQECLETASVEALDLGDGRRSILETDCGHGNANVQKFLFRPVNGRYRLVYSDGVANGPGNVELQNVQAHGLYRLRTRGGTGADENVYVYCDFDGTSYRPVACGDETWSTSARRFVISSCAPGISN